VQNYDNREMVEFIKIGYGNLNMDQKQQMLKFVFGNFELCGERVNHCGLSLFEKDGNSNYCQKENCNCAVLQYKPMFAEPVVRNRRRGQLILRNLRPVNFGLMRKQTAESVQVALVFDS